MTVFFSIFRSRESCEGKMNDSSRLEQSWNLPPVWDEAGFGRVAPGGQATGMPSECVSLDYDGEKYEQFDPDLASQHGFLGIHVSNLRRGSPFSSGSPLNKRQYEHLHSVPTHDKKRRGRRGTQTKAVKSRKMDEQNPARYSFFFLFEATDGIGREKRVYAPSYGKRTLREIYGLCLLLASGMPYGAALT